MRRVGTAEEERNGEEFNGWRFWRLPVAPVDDAPRLLPRGAALSRTNPEWAFAPYFP